MNRNRFLFVVLVGLLLAACSDDTPAASTDSEQEQEDPVRRYAEALATGIHTDRAEDSLQTTEREARCIGDRAVGVIGLDALERVGTPDEVATLAEDDLSEFDLSDDQAMRIAETTFDCIDDVLDQFVAGFGTDDPAIQACLAGEVTADDLVPLLARSLRGAELSDPESVRILQDLDSAFQTCA